MGYDRHNGILVTAFDEKKISEAHKTACDFGMSVSEVVESPINSRFSFAVFPDGSNEGWEQSNVGDAQRANLIKWLDRQRYEDGSSPFDWVEVQYGDDNKVTMVIAHSDEEARIKAADKEQPDAVEAVS